MIYIRSLFFVAVAAVCVEATIKLESSTASLAEPPFYTLYQNWLPEACLKTGITPGICVDPRSSKKHRFVLDGLGLHGSGDLVYEFCSGPPLHSEDLPDQTQSELSFYWPEAIAGSSWQEAWWSWGRCLKLSPFKYFEMALRMHQNTETPELRDFLTVSVGHEVEAYRISEAYGSKSAILLCQENTTLVAIVTCWNSSSDRISCPTNLQAAQTCGPTVYIKVLPENPKQSHLATAFYVIQYVILDYTFFQSFIGDRRNRGTLRVFAKRTAIQAFAMIHASTGVFSELWAIDLDAGGEVGLAMWPWLSMVELASNLGISVVMLSWYSFVYSLGRAKRWHAYVYTFIGIAVVLAWAAVYMKNNIDVMRSRNIKNMELLPTPYLSLSYYVIYMVLELLCLIIVFQLLDGLHRRPSIKRVFLLNLISFIDSVIMLLVYIPQVQIFLMMYWPDWHSWTMGALFFIRYVTVSFLIEPITNANDIEAETANALRFGPAPSYRFEQGRALVICNSDHTQCRLGNLNNAVDASRFVTALEYIGFVVTLRTNLDSAELLAYFEEMVNQAIAENAHGIAFAFTGHGEVDSIFGVDGVPVLIPKMQSMCAKLKLDNLVPKLFFFECCRGCSEETRRRGRSQCSWEVPLNFCQGTQNPSANANYLACYAQPRYFVTRGAGEFTKNLCEQIRRMADEGDHDIEDALKKTVWEVIRMIIGLGRRQCPTYESSLTRRFVLKAQSGRCSSADPIQASVTANVPPNSGISMQDLRQPLP